MATLAEKLIKLEAQLVEVEAAITMVTTGGQEYRFNDGQIESWVKRGNLPDLIKYKNDLETQINDINDDGGGFHAF